MSEIEELEQWRWKGELIKDISRESLYEMIIHQRNIIKRMAKKPKGAINE